MSWTVFRSPKGKRLSEKKKKEEQNSLVVVFLLLHGACTSVLGFEVGVSDADVES